MSGSDGINRVRDAADGARGTVDALTGSVKTLADSLTTLSNAGFQTNKGFDNLAAGLEGVAGATSTFTNHVDQIMSKVPVLGTVTTAVLGPLSLVAKTVEESIGAVSGAMTVAMQVMDASSKPFRETSQSLWELERAFSGSFETANKFTETMLRTVATPFARQTYMSTEALMEMANATRGTSIRLSELGDSIDTGAGSMNLWGVATAHAASMGMQATTYMDSLNKAMNRQGMTAQMAVEQMAMFGAVSEKTGLNITDVSSTLNNTAQGFEKIGMSADFGRPILEGFSNSLSSMGFGLENALGLTQSLSNAIGKLTENYGLAYITFQRGGLDIGGGGSSGVLGSSIGLQAALMDAEATGDQSGIAASLAGGLRDTLSSFTGGSIVTVGEAAQNPALQAAFYTQQQLLSRQYGMDQQTATRTLEMLAGLDEAIQSGDTDMQKELQKQISEQMNADNKTLDLQEKMNRGIGSSVALLMANNRLLYEQTRLLGDDTVGGWISSGSEGLAQMDQWLQSNASTLSEEGGMGSTPLTLTGLGLAGNVNPGDHSKAIESLQNRKGTDGIRYQDRYAALMGREGRGNLSDEDWIATFGDSDRRFAEEYNRRMSLYNSQGSRSSSSRRSRASNESWEEFEARNREALAGAPAGIEQEYRRRWREREFNKVLDGEFGVAPVDESETSMGALTSAINRILTREDPVRRVEIVAGDDLVSLVDYMRSMDGRRT